MRTMIGNYTEIIKGKLESKIRSNPRYSLRAFAKSLSLHPGYLSHLLKGTRQLSYGRAVDLVKPLGLNRTEKELFLNLVRLGSAKTDAVKEEIVKEMSRSKFLQKLKDLDLETFSAISDWYHNAILELTFKEDFVLTPKSAAKALGIEELQAKLAIDRLISLGLLKWDGTGSDQLLKKTDVHLNVKGEVPNAGLKNRHRQILTKAKDVLDQQDVSEREYQAITLCLDPNLIPEAKKRIQEFAWELCSFLESGSRKEVYEISIQLFSLERKRRKK